MGYIGWGGVLDGVQVQVREVRLRGGGKRPFGLESWGNMRIKTVLGFGDFAEEYTMKGRQRFLTRGACKAFS